MNGDSRAHDLVLFGASGFTGGLTAEYLARCAAAGSLRWALAGRNRDKLLAVRERLATLSPEAARIEIVLADAHDAQALQQLARSTRVIATTVGPYAAHGEPLLQACAHNGTHYVDLTGEPEFVDAMIERHHQAAQQSRAKIVNACGFDSVPHDLGVCFAMHQLARVVAPGTLEREPVKVEAFVRASGDFSGGTWQSALSIMGTQRQHARAHKRRAAARAAEGEGRTIRQAPLRIAYRREIAAWAVPMPTIDPEVVCRSARLLPEYGRDFEYGHYAAVRRLPTLVLGLGGLGALFALAQWQPTRALLSRIRQPGEGPDASKRAKGWFEVRVLARAGEQRVSCLVRGGDPGYGETAKMLAECALCLALEPALPERYGVIPSAVAMGEPLIARLQTAGIRFEHVPS